MDTHTHIKNEDVPEREDEDATRGGNAEDDVPGASTATRFISGTSPPLPVVGDGGRWDGRKPCDSGVPPPPPADDSRNRFFPANLCISLPSLALSSPRQPHRQVEGWRNMRYEKDIHTKRETTVARIPARSEEAKWGGERSY